MGQKAHPIGLRTGYFRPWQSTWYAETKREYVEYLLEDYRIRKFIMEYYRKSPNDPQISRINIERKGTLTTIIIHTARPGVIIGRQGQAIENLRKALKEEFGKDFTIEHREITQPDLDAQLVAYNIARRIEQRAYHRRLMKEAVTKAMRAGAKGIRVQIKGRIAGAEIARKEWYLKGRVPLQTLRANIDYGYDTAFTKWGTIGVKVWIYKGDILRGSEEEVL
ncbi:MAG: 30S ribosomal protein S3 [Candidatus Caldipriscus sp.]|jgi:small subunit ribosomal protein S3|nr:30S ribosomal protein S3 [Candidatus Caldipriscus sp.]